MDVRIRLGECLWGQTRYAEAEALLIAGDNGKASALGPDRARTQRAVRSLIKLYESQGDATHAADWRAKLSKGPSAATNE